MRILAIFEDRPFQEFVLGVMRRIAQEIEIDLDVEDAFTQGCHFRALNQLLGSWREFDGVVVGVDARRAGNAWTKETALDRRVPALQEVRAECSFLLAIAEPCIEEWIMADHTAVQQAVRAEFGDLSTVARPRKSRSERQAKQNLRDWVEGMAGTDLMRGGVELTSAVALGVDPSRIDRRRSADLVRLLEALPDFLRGHQGE